MLNMTNINSKKQILIIYIVLTAVILAVYWRVNQYDFLDLNFDNIYVTDNSNIHSGITLEGVRWAFSTTYAEYWHPVTWLSLMFDYQLYGLNSFGYHVTNLVLHILSTLLLFWLFNRMTGEIWKSAFVAALFALHPLRVESVAWIAKRRDVLCIFFSMLTLCLYVYYTEKPVIKRYLLVIFSFALALMSKPMVVTLPIIMILLDYWPLKRFESQKGNLLLWQLKEKTPFFVCSAVFSIIALHTHAYPTYRVQIPLHFRINNAVVSFVIYLEKIFWPHNLAVKNFFSVNLPIWQVFISALLIIVISIAVIVAVKRLPYLFVGWLWYAISILPVLGIIQFGLLANSDHHTYLPSIGIAVMLAWGIPLLFPSEDIRKKILFPAGIAVMIVLSVLTWRQCGYWENTSELLKHACLVTKNKNNYILHNNLASKLAEKGKIEEAIDNFNKAIIIKPDSYKSYIGRGLAYDKIGQYQRAIEDYNQAIRLIPDYAETYFNRGNSYDELGQYQQAIKDYNEAIRLNPDYVQAYNNRGNTYFSKGNNELGCRDAQKVCTLGNCRLLEFAKGKGYCL